jgi:hypothetical protein
MGRHLSSDGDGIEEYSFSLGECVGYTCEKGQEAIRVLSSEFEKMRLKKAPDEDGIEGNIPSIL